MAEHSFRCNSWGIPYKPVQEIAGMYNIAEPVMVS